MFKVSTFASHHLLIFCYNQSINQVLFSQWGMAKISITTSGFIFFPFRLLLHQWNHVFSSLHWCRRYYGGKGGRYTNNSWNRSPSYSVGRSFWSNIHTDWFFRILNPLVYLSPAQLSLTFLSRCFYKSRCISRYEKLVTDSSISLFTWMLLFSLFSVIFILQINFLLRKTFITVQLLHPFGYN